MPAGGSKRRWRIGGASASSRRTAGPARWSGPRRMARRWCAARSPTRPCRSCRRAPLNGGRFRTRPRGRLREARGRAGTARPRRASGEPAAASHRQPPAHHPAHRGARPALRRVARAPGDALARSVGSLLRAVVRSRLGRAVPRSFARRLPRRGGSRRSLSRAAPCRRGRHSRGAGALVRQHGVDADRYAGAGVVFGLLAAPFTGVPAVVGLGQEA